MFQSLFRQRGTKIVGRALYESAVERAREPMFYTRLGVADTVEGRFELYSLHVILLLHRLKSAGAQAGETAQALFDTFISQLDHALREIGVGDLSVAKKMRKLGEAFYGRAKAYDAALDAGPGAELEALIGRTLFEGAGEAGRIDALAAYVRGCVAALAGEPLAAILEGRVGWPDLTP
ncbi:MAG TPA: ubiquinol-cytochrome C chaperone family protein [Caulobacteraceae bacterium]|nr:ubiquinol-cytochrome C chaperone family protein [Caulobacteraceae bacterium]